MILLTLALIFVSVAIVKIRRTRLSLPKEFRELSTTNEVAVILRMLTGMSMVDIFERYYSSKLRETGIARTYITGKSGVMISNAEYFGYVLKNPATFPKTPLLSAEYALMNKFLGSNIMFINGESWKLRREIIGPLFHQGWESTKFGQVVQEFFKYVDSVDSIPDLYHAMQLMTLDILGAVLFGFDFQAISHPDSEQVVSYYTAAEAACNTLYITFPILDRFPVGKRYKEHQAVEYFRSLMGKLAKEKAKTIQNGPQGENEKSSDLLTALVKAWLEKRLKYEEMINEMIALIIAGHDTTATSLSCILYILAKHPEVQSKVRDEVNYHLQSHTSSTQIPSLAEIKSLQYLDAVINETLRIYPPIPLLPSRAAACDTYIGNIPIPKGTLVTLNIHAMQWDKKYWENPAKFDPDRWMQSGKAVRDLPGWGPFTGGERTC
ncbi:hypothetical protein K7432_009352 [Basidiobolus ranarum]|uniref:Cytochrome P450 n=1 Tax=Basidiobolus ranarum TaxID=34480 RepID=A0ABR2WQE5_9FUNG